MKNVTLCGKWVGVAFAGLLLAACSSNNTKADAAAAEAAAAEQAAAAAAQEAAQQAGPKHSALEVAALKLLCSTLDLTVPR